MRIIYSSLEEYIIAHIRRAINEITVVCPFIKIEPLTRILSFTDPKLKVHIITTWKLDNFLTGVSDADIFPYCRDRAIDLRANNRLHMKIWLLDHSQLLATSANISNKALGATDDFNHEFLVDSVATETDLKAIDSIRKESVVINEDIYINTIQVIEANLLPTPISNVPDLITPRSRQACYVDDLPIVQTPEELYELYSQHLSDGRSPEVQHDIDRLELPEGLDRECFLAAVRRSFFRLPIIRAVIDRLRLNPLFFGEMKKLLQELHDLDPKPFRRELTLVTQNVYKWLVELSPEDFMVKTPHISEQISYIKQEN